MGTFRRVTRSVTVWAAVIAAAGSITGGVISQQGGEGASQTAPAVDCRAALDDTRRWATAHAEDAGVYAEKGDAEELGAPSLFSDEEHAQCNGDPEVLLERNPPPAAGAMGRLRGADLRGRNLSGENFAGTDAQGASLVGTRLNRTHLEGANLRGADLRGATLRDACLRGADLREARLRGTDVTGADLRGARIERRHALIGVGRPSRSACN